jgi:hypothetical protein
VLWKRSCRRMTGRDRNVQPAQRRLFSLFISAVALALAACGGRDVPSEWPRKAAASPAGEAAPPAFVTRALDGPPPLPGEDASGWVGLSAPSEAGDHDHSRHGPAAHDDADRDDAGRDRSGREPAGAAVRYVCPMHPDVVADQPGTCPRCGMGLVKRDAPK